MDFDEVAKLTEIQQLRFWLKWVMENCDDSPEYNFGTDATERINKLLEKS